MTPNTAAAAPKVRKNDAAEGDFRAAGVFVPSISWSHIFLVLIACLRDLEDVAQVLSLLYGCRRATATVPPRAVFERVCQELAGSAEVPPVWCCSMSPYVGALQNLRYTVRYSARALTGE